MKATHTRERTVLNLAAIACILMIMALILATLTSACSDTVGSVEVTPEVISFHLTAVPQTPSSGIQKEENAEIYAPSNTDDVIVSANTGAKSPPNDEDGVIVSANTGAKSPPNDEDESEDVIYRTYATLLPDTGPLSLEERILRADVIARATLTSVSTTTPFLSDSDLGTTTSYYVSTLELKFDAHEYLKGTGGDTLLVELALSFQDYYPSVEEAVEAVSAWLPDRDTRWDNREAIIFLQNPIGSQSKFSSPRSNNYVFSIYTFGYGDAHDLGTAYAISERYVDTYSIRSEKNKVWLPATSASVSGASGASGAVEASYYLEEPPSPNAGVSGASGQSVGASSITLSDLKSQVKAMDTLVKQGAGVDGYRRCLEEKYADERYIKSQGVEGISTEASLGLSSGLPAGSVFNEGRIFGGGPDAEYFRYLFKGPDAHLFEIGVEDDDSDARSYSVVATTTRPLHRGMYEIHYNVQSWLFFPCDYISNSYMRWLIHVTAPEGTLHEAFFDPVLDTSSSAVGADGANGVLKPSAFAGSGGATATATTTIRSLTWKSGAVKMNVSPHTAINGHILDFIELDGTVSLSLRAADATADADNSTLSWTAPSQPWEEGDTLMLRIRKELNRAPEFDTSTYAFRVREDAPVGHVIGFVSASDPDEGDSAQYYITDGNEARKFEIGSSNGRILIREALDYESVSSYTLTLEARDGKENGTATATAQITVTNVGE